MKKSYRGGEPMVLVSGLTLAIILVMTLTLACVILVNGLGFFWPKQLTSLELGDGTSVLGQITGREQHAITGEEQIQIKVANRDIQGQDFRWVDGKSVVRQQWPVDAVLFERREYGDFFGYLKGVIKGEGEDLIAVSWPEFISLHKETLQKQKSLETIKKESVMISRQSEKLRLLLLKLEYKNGDPVEIADLKWRMAAFEEQFYRLNDELNSRRNGLLQVIAVMSDSSGREKMLPVMDVIRGWQPNRLSMVDKMAIYLAKLKELLLDQPRESNTEGGLFPAIFGTVLMVLLMSLFSLPLGVLAAVYLRVYAKDGWLVRTVWIAVNNLAGVPSIVYGLFGLGFFVYGIGGSIDALFYPERLPTPTFGTGGILWASLTLALLTVPVVIVATEESLASIPKGIREGSLALGASRLQTLVRLLLPMATPGIMTGMVLAMARAAGEVAPLMMVGVVKLAPALPFDSQFPFFHPDRKFMHLGFHIFDVGFQSPNVEAARPMVFITTLLLLLIVIMSTSLAICFRNRMRKKYNTSHF